MANTLWIGSGDRRKNNSAQQAAVFGDWRNAEGVRIPSAGPFSLYFRASMDADFAESVRAWGPRRQFRFRGPGQTEIWRKTCHRRFRRDGGRTPNSNAIVA